MLGFVHGQTQGSPSLYHHLSRLPEAVASMQRPVSVANLRYSAVFNRVVCVLHRSVYCIHIIYIYVYIVYIIYIHNSNNNNYRSFYLLYIVLYCVYIYIDVHNYGSRLSSTKVASQAISNTALGSSRLWRVWPGASQKSSLRISSNGGVSFGQRILQPASQVSQVASQTASCKSCTGHATHRQSSP
jgi:hypothetical protein